MASRCNYENSSDIGVFGCLTNKYALLPHNTPESFSSLLSLHLGADFPVLKVSIGETGILGRMCVGNSHGLILPQVATEAEIDCICNSLPDSIEVAQVKEKNNALGNVISCNDRVALVQDDLEPVTIETIGDVLGVEVIPVSSEVSKLTGTYTALTNSGAVFSPEIMESACLEFSEMLGMDILQTTVNRGSLVISAGLLVNDDCLFCGSKTTALEVSSLSRGFRIFRECDDLNDMFDDKIANLLI